MSMAFDTSVQPGMRTQGDNSQAHREDWVLHCATRLRQLRPSDDPAFIVSVASHMWEDVASFYPLIAAEMEHEVWPWDD